MFTQARLIGGGIALLGFALFVAWALRVDHLRGKHLADKIAVTAQVAKAVGNPKLKFADIGRQVELTVQSRDEWKASTIEQTAAINAMGKERERLLALNADLRAKAKAEIAKREVLINRLDSQSLTAGGREDYQAQIQAVEAALDAIYEEGV
jgi:formylmethanofuran dehydrogenase subunit E